jgi:GNAT superfamily N-acetyltransferase
MIRKIAYRLKESFDILRSRGFRYLFRRYIYFNKIWVIVEKDLPDFENKVNPGDGKLQFLAITRDNLDKKMLRDNEEDHFYRIQSYLVKGYQGYMLMNNNDFLGYIWYSPITTGGAGIVHPDARHIDVSHNKPSAYMFSMYLRPDKRGGNMGAYIYSSLLDLLKNKGFEKAYAVYDIKNIPALWVNRVLRFKEIGRLKISQVICYKFVVKQPALVPSST